MVSVNLVLRPAPRRLMARSACLVPACGIGPPVMRAIASRRTSSPSRATANTCLEDSMMPTIAKRMAMKTMASYIEMPCASPERNRSEGAYSAARPYLTVPAESMATVGALQYHPRAEW